jgi:hypothetical protein
MDPVGTGDGLTQDRASQAHDFADAIVADRPAEREQSDSSASSGRKYMPVPRRTPRISLIVVLPENHVVSPDRLAQGLRAHGDQDVDVVVACAGQPANLSALQRSAGDAQFVLAPVGTTTEDLRQLAMQQTPGDIVTLLSGALLPELSTSSELSMTS